MRKHFILIGVMLLFLVGIAAGYFGRSLAPSGSQPAPPPSPTSILSPSPTPAPREHTPTPTPSPSPTPILPQQTPAPSPAVSFPAMSLRDLLWLEDYAMAEREIRRLLESAPEDIHSVLRLLLAHTLFAQERYEEAEHILASLKGNICDEQGLACVPRDILLLYARSLEALGRNTKAIRAYRHYLASDPPPILADEAYRALAALYRQTGQHRPALEAYQQAIDLAPIESRPYIRRDKAAYLAELERWDEALALYTQLVTPTIPAALRARALLERGQIYLNLDRKEEALADWQAAVEIAVNTRGGAQPARVIQAAIPWAHQALVLLVAAGARVDDYSRGVVDVEAGAYWPAITALVRYLDTVKPHFGDAHAYLARALAAVGRSRGVEEQWRALIDTHPECPCWEDAWFALARHYRLNGQGHRARALMQELLHHPQASPALQERARLYMADQDLGNGNLRAARRAYASLAFEAQTPQVRNRAALLAAVLSLPQDPQTAAQFVDHALAFPLHPHWAPVLRYWQGRIYQERGETAQAVETWQDLAAERPQSYYAFRAAEQLETVGAPVPPWRIPRLTGPSGSSEGPSTSPADILTGPPLENMPPEVTGLLQRAHAYEVAGQAVKAYPLYRRAVDLLNTPEDLLALGAYLNATLYPDLGIRAALRALHVAGLDERNAPPEYWPLLYPLPARAYIESLAREHDLDPALLYALIRQESHFATAATSTAGARGLMQLIPATGRYVARSMGLSLTDEADIYQPTLNLRLGTYFLATLVKRFEGNVPVALAGYNAGPGNAAYWVKTFGPETDRLLELIPVLETRTYLRAVLRQWKVYRQRLEAE